MTDKRPLIIISGPTAVGKSSIAVRLAKLMGGEVISADSMQIYRYMDIGTAKIKKEEMSGIPHHLLDMLDPSDSCSAARYKELAVSCIEDIYSRNKVPILCGGTGFYIQAVLYDVDFTFMERDEDYCRKLYDMAAADDGQNIHKMLEQIDPMSAMAIPYQNKKRVIRAIEFYHMTGTKISEHNIKERQKSPAYNSVYFALTDKREVLYEKINARVEKMMEQGFLGEVESLVQRGYTRDMTSMQALGYRELLAYLSGECSIDEAVLQIKQNTRHYAKRQLTWLRRERDVIWIDKSLFDSEDEILEYMYRLSN